MKCKIHAAVRVNGANTEELPFILEETRVIAGELAFSIDHVYNRSATNTDVYNTSVTPLIETFIAGASASVFAYGPSGSGKTHTMVACDDSVLWRAAEALLALGRGGITM